MGRPKEHSDYDLLLEVALLPGPVVTAPEVAERIGMNNSGVNKRFRDFVDRGLLHRKKVGANAVVYWLTDDGRQFLSER